MNFSAVLIAAFLSSSAASFPKASESVYLNLQILRNTFPDKDFVRSRRIDEKTIARLEQILCQRRFSKFIHLQGSRVGGDLEQHGWSTVHFDRRQCIAHGGCNRASFSHGVDHALWHTVFGFGVFDNADLYTAGLFCSGDLVSQSTRFNSFEGI